MFNDLMLMLSDVPLTLAAGWVAWFLAGALLAVWYRRAQADIAMHQTVATAMVARAKSGPRPTAMHESRGATPQRPFAVAVPRSKPGPVVVGDPFGDLSTLLDQPAAGPKATVPEVPKVP